MPFHVPVEAVSVWPWRAVPVIDGASEMLGAVAFVGGATGAGATSAVGSEVSVVEPQLFVAVTASRSTFPTSAVVSA